jgi:hypothetical protein
MRKSRCTKCHKVKDVTEFYIREDTFNSTYAWCKACMKEQGRSPEYPPLEERGSGVYHPNYKSLRPGYIE